ncbi:MAG: EAL domain-containing protein [Pseudomonadota bacterium]
MRDTIRKLVTLNTGVAAAQVAPDETAGTTLVSGTALLVTRDAVSKRWAPRWLGHMGLKVKVVDTAVDAIHAASEERPALMLCDTSMLASNGTPVIRTLRKMYGKDVPLIALCESGVEAATATDSDVTDLARRPYDWQLIAHRAAKAVRAHETLAKLRAARDRIEAMETADRDQARAAGLDALTGLPGSDRFRSLLTRAMASRDEMTRRIGLLAIGLDRFRMVNEAIGREDADRLLGMFADRLRDCLADRSIIGDAEGQLVTAVAARLRGARFAMMISNATTEDVVRIQNAVRTMLEEPFEVGGQSVYLTASRGAAMYPKDYEDADKLVHSAESAMLEAQDDGTEFRFHRPLTDSHGGRLLKIDNMLREAIRNHDLTLAYQPITDVRTGKVLGAEALLRWVHEEEGAMSPADFVPVAEKTGLMQEIGEFVINKACGQLREWLDDGIPPLRMALNLSLCQLLRGDIVATVEKALEEHQLAPELVEIELSERGVLNKSPEVIEQVRRLKALGVRISIDDFGTGQAAIGYLKDLPVDVIKIDRSYVSGAASSDREEAIASGMVALAHRLNASVVAEGVETPEQLEMLRGWGSEECQGFYFSPAVPPNEFRQIAKRDTVI